MPVNPGHGIVLAGEGVGAPDGLAPIIKAVLAARSDIVRGLRESEVAVATAAAAPDSRTDKKPAVVGDIETLLQSADSTGLSDDDIDSYWEAAAAEHGNKPISKDVIPYEEARKLGLTPDGDGK